MATLGAIGADEFIVTVTTRVLRKEENCTPAVADATKQEIATIYSSTNSAADTISKRKTKSEWKQIAENPTYHQPPKTQ
jgi:hypothetical protein